MPVQLLPASAAAFAPRASSVNVVLGNKVEPWLTQTLKRVSRVKRPLNSVPQHQRCLADLLSSPNAIWTLASLMLPNLADADHPDADLDADPDMPADPLEHHLLFSHRLVHVEAYIVHVDMVLRNEVAYKLTPDTIAALVGYHEQVHCVDAKANTYDWPDKDQQCRKLHDDFVQAVNRFVYRAHATALEGLEEEGAGELLIGKSDEVKSSLMALMKPLLPPPPPPPPPPPALAPRVVHLVRQPPLLPSSSPASAFWSQPPPSSSLPAVDAWRVLPSSPGLATSSAESDSTPVWTTLGMSDVQMPSSPPALAFTQPYSSSPFYFGSPPIQGPMLAAALPLPSMLASSQCGVSVGVGVGVGMGMGGFGWDRYQEYATIM
ncbi:hypothetical protein UVI_02003930 [Ustilaginoidea virens]|uniref:Uncharacterized protein n=1 Tax=Ustilaginoidea virens TaxID=1159556 RepID=A0A1B5KSM3_USTVR|nr:hypothetical protein UVI_02003930 [Ustilaginoidea virens]